MQTSHPFGKICSSGGKNNDFFTATICNKFFTMHNFILNYDSFFYLS
jgi:hypothetical protein